MSTSSPVHICVPTGLRYIAQVRREGCRYWTKHGPRRRSQARAVMDMARMFSQGGYKRGRVLSVADWYEPSVVVEMNR